MKKKNPAAVALGLKSARSRMKNKTAEQRQEQARAASQARWAKAKPQAKLERWWGLVECPDLTDRWDAAGNPKPLPEPTLLKWSRDKQELRDEVRRLTAYPLPERNLSIIELAYNPRHLIVKREFAPNVEAQVKALRTLLAEEEGGTK